ncbi:MAG: putative membrane protein affecting hemolysin expression, partial [Candidatus Azotimanducaceae bacterium]
MLSTPRIRLILLAILPIVVSAMVMSVVVTTVTEKRMQAQNEQFSRTLTSYLAMTIAEHLVNNDALGINVLLSRMQEESALDYASVYDAQNQLIAQVGQHGAASNAFSREISFQDTTAGYIQVGFSSDAITAQSSLALSLVLVFHLILGFVICGFIWFAGDLATVWIFGRQSVDAQP